MRGSVKTGAFTKEETERYSRHFLLSEVGEAGQEKLRSSKVALIGCGGLGSPAALYLAAAGVGTLRLIEPDVVDLSNLQRQILFSEEDRGRTKIQAATARLKSLNSGVTIETREEKLSAQNALSLLQGCDLVLDGSDNFATRYVVNDACVKLRLPLVSASVLRFEGHVGVYNWRGGPCYRCLFSEAPPPGFAPACSEAGVLGVVPGVLGTLQATEALKILLGVGEPLSGRFLTMDLLRNDHQTLTYHKNPSCAACADPDAIVLKDETEACEPSATLNARALKARLDRGETLILLDVREPSEAAICRLPGSLLIPLAQLAVRTSEIPAGEIVAYCKSGRRSVQATLLLQARGRSVSNLEGGILSWIDEVDASLQRY